jgi:hypothetical protein
MVRHVKLSPEYWKRREEILLEGKAKAEITIDLLKFGMGYEQVVQLTELPMGIIEKLAQELKEEKL